ncbi:MAG: hypothetical protein ACE5HQ_03455 [Gemmatimonadota bacterium]
MTVAATACVLVALGRPAPVAAQGMGSMPGVKELIKLAPGRGYLKAHSSVAQPLPLVGGPIEVDVTQTSGGVFVSLPDHRKLDSSAFGTPEHPRAFAGTPVINGLPPMMRESAGGAYTRAKPMSPFGDKFLALPGGKLMLKAWDVTATDGAATEDKVQFHASWKDKAGNTYEVKCCKMLASHGVEYPTFGGVVTNHLLHGFTRIGTALMPTEFTYVAFWGMGSVSKNGKVLQAPRLIHGMLTEYARGQGYKLDSDAEVTPTRTQFHLMVPPMMPSKEMDHFEPNPVNTGFSLPNGMQLPFWHVMFENLTVNSHRGNAGG